MNFHFRKKNFHLSREAFLVTTMTTLTTVLYNNTLSIIFMLSTCCQCCQCCQSCVCCQKYAHPCKDKKKFFLKKRGKGDFGGN